MSTKILLLLSLFTISFLGQAQFDLIGSDTITIPCPKQSYDYRGFILKANLQGGTWKDINYKQIGGGKAIIQNDSIFPLDVSNNTRSEFHTLIYELEINSIKYLDTAVIHFKNRLSYYANTSPSIWSHSFNCGDTILLEWENPIDSVVYEDGIERNDTFIVKNNYEAHYYFGYVDGCRLDYGYDNYIDSIFYSPQEKCLEVTSINNTFIKEIELYPNPSNGTFNLSHLKGVVSVYDISGRILFEQKITSGIINLNGFKPGSYLIKIRDEDVFFSGIGIIK